MTERKQTEISQKYFGILLLSVPQFPRNHSCLNNSGTPQLFFAALRRQTIPAQKTSSPLFHIQNNTLSKSRNCPHCGQSWTNRRSKRAGSFSCYVLRRLDLSGNESSLLNIFARNSLPSSPIHAKRSESTSERFAARKALQAEKRAIFYLSLVGFKRRTCYQKSWLLSLAYHESIANFRYCPKV